MKLIEERSFSHESNELPAFVVIGDYGGRVKAGLGKFRDSRSISRY